VSKAHFRSAPEAFLFLASTGGGSLVQSYFRAVLKDPIPIVEQQCISQSWVRKEEYTSCSIANLVA